MRPARRLGRSCSHHGATRLPAGPPRSPAVWNPWNPFRFRSGKPARSGPSIPRPTVRSPFRRRDRPPDDPSNETARGGFPPAEYLTETLRAIVRKDFDRAVKAGGECSAILPRAGPSGSAAGKIFQVSDSSKGTGRGRIEGDQPGGSRLEAAEWRRVAMADIPAEHVVQRRSE